MKAPPASPARKKRATLLRAVRKRLGVPGQWTKFALAVDETGCSLGFPADPCDPRAVAWCLNGAFFAEAPELLTRAPKSGFINKSPFATWPPAAQRQGALLGEIARGKGYANTVELNNDPRTKHADILAVLDEAIAAYEAPA